MLAFTLGTAPLFILIGVLARGTAVLQRRLTALAAIVVMGLGVYSINGALVAFDSPYSFQNEVAAFRAAFGAREEMAAARSEVTIAVSATGYAPASVTVPAGEPVSISLQGQGALGCVSVFLIPKLSIVANLRQGTTLVTATFPERGRYRFTCGMGMYSGIIDAV
jgi:plastocyanin